MSGFIVKKNPAQKVKYKLSTISGKQFKEHMAHLRTAEEKAGESVGTQTTAPNKA